MTELQGIGDRLEIGDVLIRVGTALDTHDPQLLVSCFTGDAVLQFDQSAPSSPAEFAQRARRLRDLAAVQHIITNIAVELGEDRARSRCYVLVMEAHGQAAGHRTLMTGGVYADELTRTPDGWRISERRFTSLWAVAGTDVVTPTHDRLPVGA